jgi:hypothetical protein
VAVVFEVAAHKVVQVALVFGHDDCCHGALASCLSIVTHKDGTAAPSTPDPQPVTNL